MNTFLFFYFFLCSGILFLRNGAASYNMESLSLCLTLSFKYCFNMIAKINTNKNYLESFKNILLIFYLFFFIIIFFMFKEITGLCSLRNGVSFYKMELYYLFFLHLVY